MPGGTQDVTPLVGIEGGIQVWAEIVDTKGMSRNEPAPPRPHKKTAIRNLAMFRELNAEEEINQEERAVIPVLYAQKAATSAGICRTGSAGTKQPRSFHLVFAIRDGLSVIFKVLAKSFFLVEDLTKLHILRPGLCHFFFEHRTNQEREKITGVSDDEIRKKRL